MKILGATQGSNLRIFLRLVEMLKEPLGLEATSAYVADSQEFYALKPQEPLLGDSNLPLLKEWKITRDGLKRQPDWDVLKEWETSLGDPVFWNALIADRRIFFGRRCKLRQDYKPRFSQQQMYAILQTAVERIAQFLDEQKPDVIISFGTANFGDYLLYRFARARNLVFLQLKSTKIGNYVSLNDDVIDLSKHIVRLIEAPHDIPDDALGLAKKHMAQIREKGIQYEGALKSTTRFRPLRGSIGLMRGLVRDSMNRFHKEIGKDNHVERAFYNALYVNFLQPIKSSLLSFRLKKATVKYENLDKHQPFVFFPLHFEPEVSLQVFGRPFQNQIEVVRNIALNLPAGMSVLVKEHPRALGFRPYGYYRNLLDIPNVKLVDPLLSTHLVIRHAALVAVISGSTGLESAVLGKPVITFGLPTYRDLSATMIRNVQSLHDLGSEIRDLLDTFYTDESALERFIAAHIASAIPIDLYSVLLGKQGRHSEGREGLTQADRRDQDYRSLVEYCCQRINAESANADKI